MKKFILVLLLIVSIFSSFMVVSAFSACPQCGGLEQYKICHTLTSNGYTISCSHHPGYLDTVYNEYRIVGTGCSTCGYEECNDPELTGTYIVCGYDGSIYYQ